MSSIYDWSLFAANNSNADMLINWAEGQPPSSVNNSARSMMQRIREYIADQSGSLLASGTASAFQVAMNSPVSQLENGIVARFRALVTNSGNTTLNLNNIGAMPIYKASANGLAPLSGGEMQAGGIYDLIYSKDLNGGNGGFLLSQPTPTQAIPSGQIAAFAMPIAPDGWLACNGAAISRTVYANLFAAIGTIYGAGDGSTTFNLPDLRGMFLRGFDGGRGIDSGRVFGSRQESDNKEHNHDGDIGEAGDHTHLYSDNGFLAPGWPGAGQGTTHQGSAWATRQTQNAGIHSHELTLEKSGGIEARPVNIAIFYAIKV